MIEVYLMDGMAFVDLGAGYMLCIGSKAEVDKATPERLMEMINEAVMHSKYRGIESSKGVVVH